jgi:SAM-dependent methyltransferase
MTADGHAKRAPAGEESEWLRARLGRHRWTAHNLELAPGVRTLPGSPDLLKADSRLKAILQMCRALYRGRLSTLRVLDLGCLEGGYSVGLALAGAQVLGVEAREEHMEKCILAQDALALPGLEFARADVKAITVERFGSFDAVLALGILYHLDDPVGWLRQVAALTRGILFVDTHYAPADEMSLAAVRPELGGRLGALERFDSHGLAVAGRWYREWDVEAERDTMPWASWSNPRSLWLTKESLARAMRHAGFDVVAEQYDHWLDRYEVFTTEYPRTMMIGLKSPSSE